MLNEELLLQCHKELDGKKAVGVDEVTREKYSQNLRGNLENLVKRLKYKSYKTKPTRRVYIPKANGKKRPFGIASYEDKIVQLGLKKILESVYEQSFKKICMDSDQNETVIWQSKRCVSASCANESIMLWTQI